MFAGNFVTLYCNSINQSNIMEKYILTADLSLKKTAKSNQEIALKYGDVAIFGSKNEAKYYQLKMALEYGEMLDFDLADNAADELEELYGRNQPHTFNGVLYENGKLKAFIDSNYFS